MDDTCKRHRMDIMDDYLASIGQLRKPIPKDGSSLFRAVSEQLFSTQVHQVEIREQCVAHMRKNKEEFEHFVDIPFGDYLERMMNPKEWGDQLEICALSQLYTCDFYIYEKPGQAAKNVTENSCDKKIYLCHSGQKHYDCVYPSRYFTVFGICQSIVNSILLTNVLGVNKNEEKKLLQTFRMLSSSKSETQDEEKSKTAVEQYPLPSVYEPSIGTIDELLPIEMQSGLAYQLPFCMDFIRSLDPSICRNIDYDFWISIKRRQQYIDYSIAEGLQYCIGDRCLICLNIYSKPLVGHVQEISPNNGPITVFLEALGGMHTVAVKNVKPLEVYDNSCCNDYWNSRWRRRPNDGNWNARGRNYQKFSKILQKSDKCASSSFRNGSRRYDDETSFQQRKGKEKEHFATGLNSRKSYRSFNEKNGCSKNSNSDEVRSRTRSNAKSSPSEDDHREASYQGRNKRSLGRSRIEVNFSDWVERRKVHYQVCHQKHKRGPTYPGELSPSQMVRQLSIAPDTYNDDSWQPFIGNCSEANIAIPPFPGSVYEWENKSTSSTYTTQMREELPNVTPQDPCSPENYNPDGEFWEQENGGPCSSYTFDKRETDNENPMNQNIEVVPNCDVSNRIVPVKSRDDEHDATYQALPGDSVVEDGSDDLLTLGQTSEIFATTAETFGQPSESYAAYGLPQGATYPPGPSTAVPQARAMCSPYSGSITMLDCEGKEVVLVDEKNPFQYFYNLGLEYYRQINAGNPRPVPVVYGASIPSNPYGSPPMMHPHHVGYFPGPGSPQFVPPSMPPPGCSLSMPHYYPMVSPPQGGAMHVPVSPGQFLVHIPPAPQPPASSSVANTTSDLVSSSDSHGTDITTGVSPHEMSHDNICSQAPGSNPAIPTYPGIMPGVPLYAGPPFCCQSGLGDSGAIVRPQFCPTVQTQLRNPFLG